jgi:diadenosine tetraphosphate (Ap4A) HIT family hydrolase
MTVRMSEPAWSLHPQLQNDTTPVGDLVLSRLLAINDADYPWLVLVPRRAGASEIADLGDDTGRLMAEIVQVSRLLKEVTRCDKLNIGAIGNVVPQLHIHIVGRRKHDPLWPKPVWGATQRAGETAAFAHFVTAIRKGLSPALSSPAKAGEGDHP